MALELFCVDGTNIVRGCYGYGGPQFRRQEELDCRQLVEGLAQVCLRLGSRVEVHVFFDGTRRSLGEGGVPANLRVRFTEAEEADELILDRVRAGSYAGAGRVTVVTGDGDLGRKAAEEGGRWLRVSRGADLEGVVGSIARRFGRGERAGRG